MQEHAFPNVFRSNVQKLVGVFIYVYYLHFFFNIQSNNDVILKQIFSKVRCLFLCKKLNKNIVFTLDHVLNLLFNKKFFRNVAFLNLFFITKILQFLCDIYNRTRFILFRILKHFYCFFGENSLLIRNELCSTVDENCTQLKILVPPDSQFIHLPPYVDVFYRVNCIKVLMI